MLLTIKQKKILKALSYLVQVILIIVFITLSCVCGKQHKTIKSQKQQIKAQTALVDSLKNVNSVLGAEDVFTVNVHFNLTQKNVLSFSQTNAQNIAKEVATLTRQELYDSLYVKTK